MTLSWQQPALLLTLDFLALIRPLGACGREDRCLYGPFSDSSQDSHAPLLYLCDLQTQCHGGNRNVLIGTLHFLPNAFQTCD